MPVQRGASAASKRDLAPYQRRNARSTKSKPTETESGPSGCDWTAGGIAGDDAVHHGIDLGQAQKRRETRSSDASDNTSVQYEEPPCPSSETCNQLLPHLQVNTVQNATRYIGNSHVPVDGWFQACRGCSAWTATCLDLEGRDIPMCRRCQARYRRITSGQDGSAAFQVSPTPQEGGTPQWMKQMNGQVGRQASLEERQDMCQQALLQLEENWTVFMAKERQKPAADASAAT